MHAWILGAGFSARLGGPLLDGLLHPSALKALRIRHPDTWLTEPGNDLVVRVFMGGKGEFWANAEDFLSALTAYDSVLEENTRELRKRVATDLGLSNEHEEELEALIGTATALVAAQCADFAERSCDDREAWLPYDRWSRAVGPGDVFVSFNYDDVVERAFRRCERPLHVPNPRLNPGRIRQPTQSNMLLKLHGGVEIRDTILEPYEPPTISNLVRNPAFIATPGTAKAELTEYDLDDLWEAAEEVLTKADRVSIVGYSCPASDEKSKALLLDTLNANPNKPTVDLVLGPGGLAAAVRLKSLLGFIGLNVVDTKLWAEDYLSAFGVGNGWMPNHAPSDEGDEGDDV